MSDPNDLTDTIVDAAQKPAAFQVGDLSGRQRDLSDLIEADRYLAAKAAAKKSPLAGVRLVQIIPGRVI